MHQVAYIFSHKRQNHLDSNKLRSLQAQNLSQVLLQAEKLHHQKQLLKTMMMTMMMTTMMMRSQ
jgi:hypothetical protein